MEAATRRSLVELLQEYRDALAFGSEEMPSIDPVVIEHRLNVDPAHKRVIHKKRHMGLRRAAPATAKVKKSLETGFIRECQYPKWISNIVLVRKPNRTWRMYVNFTNLNNACLKQSYPLPKIKKLVDTTVGHALLSSMDVFSRYHQIPFCSDDQEKTAFELIRGYIATR